ncbi:cytochrome P450 [Phytohabitans flavus]|uniref:Cytochrome P450 n=1 Tax=Phytohabitans flavus TaxID=1076124 RepID=A0A6F8XPJ5_9ACTN|nr:cytochrome P450 [Phytohabitans flavus]BCB75746.1 cytochrome P450 [Phytohabitans flavus]
MSAPFAATAEGERHAAYAELARRGPVHRISLPTGVPIWLVTGYEQARSLLTDPRVVKGGWDGRTRWTPPGQGLPEALSRGLYTHMLTQDPPDHGRLRKLVGKAFTRRRIDLLQPTIAKLAGELLDALRDEETTDLMATYAAPLPIAVITELVGVPPEARADFRGWATPLMSPGILPRERIEAAATALHRYTLDLVATKRAAPRDDLLSDLIAAREDGERLTEDELTSSVYLIVFAGHETTVNLIGNGVLALLTHPDQLAKLRAHPELIDRAVEEFLRFDPPVQGTLPYLTTEPVEVAGVTIPADELVMFAAQAANRDPAVFAAPDTFDIERERATHLAFGHGVHHCLGAPLARVQGRIAFEALLDRFPRIRLNVPAHTLTRTPSMVLNALTTLPVSLR